MKRSLLVLVSITTLVFNSCEDDDIDAQMAEIEVIAPTTYSFERDGESTVSFSGQTTRILMSEALVDATLDFDNTTTDLLLDRFANENNPFDIEALNNSDKNIRGKIAASQDYFFNDPSTSAVIRAFFEAQLIAQVEEVFPAQFTQAAVGVAGQIADGPDTRYVNAKGIEYDQVVAKGLIGALMIDQIINNYLSVSVLDAGTNREDNDLGITEEGKPYTIMEHKWDEAFGYLYGNAPDVANANVTTGNDDGFLNRYLGRIDGDADFTGISQEIFEAFKLGRAAIVAKNYELRDAQVVLLRERFSKIIGVFSVYYLQQAKMALNSDNLGTAFHDLSEGIGFIYSLQFTRNPDTDAPYFSKEEAEDMIEQLSTGNGLWDVTPETLDALSGRIADRYDFTVIQAGS